MRIGNYVYATVAGNVSDKMNIHQIHSGTGIDNAEWYYPIPLTEDILLRLGFEPRNEHKGIGAIYDYDSKVENKEIKWKFEKSVAFVHDKNDINDVYLTVLAHPTAYKIKHLHQLQNLFYALTGEELTLNP
nr:hypothetical protein [uncultured Flavobacterium sp.]